MDGNKENEQLQHQVWVYYCGCDPPCCVRCGSKDHLQIDHIAGNGGERRKQDPSHRDIYHWLKKHYFPTGYETLCRKCNIQKRKEKKGYILGSVRVLTPEEKQKLKETGLPPEITKNLVKVTFPVTGSILRREKEKTKK